MRRLTLLTCIAILCVMLMSCANEPDPKQYDGTHNVVVDTGRMVTKRFGHHALLLPSGEVVIVDGRIAKIRQHPEHIATVEKYSPETGRFRLAGQLVGRQRAGSTATLLPNGKILITGGDGRVGDMVGGCLRQAELYDPVTETSKLVGDLNHGRQDHQATLLKNGQVLITGGTCNKFSGPNYTLNSAEIFDPTTERFRPIAMMNDRRTHHQMTLLEDGNVLVTGGGTYRGRLKTAELYDARKQKFIKLPEMSIERITHAATRLNTGDVLVAGGQTLKYPWVTNTVEIYHWKNRSFEKVGSLEENVDHGQSFLLPDGRVFIIGSNSHLYDPTSKTCSKGPDMYPKRAYDASVSLKNGDVLITGGGGVSRGDYQRAQLYKF